MQIQYSKIIIYLTYLCPVQSARKQMLLLQTHGIYDNKVSHRWTYRIKANSSGTKCMIIQL